MLGGRGHHKGDIRAGKLILSRLENFISGYNSALDMAAGIGRISKDILTQKFSVTDMEEIDAKSIEKAKKYCPKIRNFYHKSI